MTAGRGARRVSGVDRGSAFEFFLDGERVTAHPGETIAAALLAAGHRLLRHTASHGQPRGIYCAMGVCGECALTVNGEPGVRACVTPAVASMLVERPRRPASTGSS